MKHNHFLRLGETGPMSNLFVSMLHALGIVQGEWVDSTGPLDGLA